MAKKVKLTRPELKRYRDQKQRYQRYLPMLKLKQQQLQMSIRDINKKKAEVLDLVNQAKKEFDSYRQVKNDLAGVNVDHAAAPAEIQTSVSNIAGVKIPVLEEVTFSELTYSLFATPAWVDKVIEQLKLINSRQAELDVLNKQQERLQRELTKISQRVNLFEKIKIPECNEAIHKIRIKLGDEMTAAVGRSKIAKSKIIATGD